MSWPFSPAATNLRYLTKARPCALVFEVASKNFFRRDWISCRGLVVGFLCRRTQVEIWSWGGGAVGRAEIIAVSVNPFQYFQMEMFLRLMKTSSLQKTKGRSRGLAYTSQQYEQVNREPAWNLEERDEDASLLSGLRNKKRNKKREGTHPRKSDEPSRSRV